MFSHKVILIQDSCNHHEHENKCEEYDTKWINISGNLNEHFNQEAELFIVTNKLHEFDSVLYDHDN